MGKIIELTPIEEFSNENKVEHFGNNEPVNHLPEISKSRDLRPHHHHHDRSRAKRNRSNRRRLNIHPAVLLKKVDPERYPFNKKDLARGYVEVPADCPATDDAVAVLKGNLALRVRAYTYAKKIAAFILFAFVNPLLAIMGLLALEISFTPAVISAAALIVILGAWSWFVTCRFFDDQEATLYLTDKALFMKSWGAYADTHCFPYVDDVKTSSKNEVFKSGKLDICVHGCRSIETPRFENVDGLALSLSNLKRNGSYPKTLNV